jgi:hypothetical protein
MQSLRHHRVGSTYQHPCAEDHDQAEQAPSDRNPERDDPADHERGASDETPDKGFAHRGYEPDVSTASSAAPDELLSLRSGACT